MDIGRDIMAASSRRVDIMEGMETDMNKLKDSNVSTMEHTAQRLRREQIYDGIYYVKNGQELCRC